MTRARKALKSVVRRIRRPAKRFTTPHGLVLMYHRVAVEQSDPWNLCVTPEHFAEHLAVLEEVADIVPLRELSQRLKRRGARPSVAITFDDGYVDNLTAALPVLQQFSAPATIFIATDWIGHAGPFWWDSLAQLILEPRRLPEIVRVATASVQFSRSAAPRESTPAAERQMRRTLHLQLWRVLQTAPPAERAAALRQLREQIAPLPVSPASLARPMTARELRSVRAGGLIDIGAHTRTHAPLPKCTAEDQRDEIVGSRDGCEAFTGERPTCFAFPYGEFDSTSRGLVAEAGFECACSTVADLVWQGSDPLLMPRYEAPNLAGDGFRRALRSTWLP